MFLRPRRSRYSQQASQAGGRFRRRGNPGEELAGKTAQALIMTVLAAALLTLCFKSIHMVKVHFIAKYGAQAWALPVGIGLIFLFILYHLLKVWRELRRSMAEIRSNAQETDIEEDN